MPALAKAESTFSVLYKHGGAWGAKVGRWKERDDGQGSMSAPRRQLGLSSF